MKENKKATLERYKEYGNLQALLNMSDAELLEIIGAGAKTKGVCRVKNVLYIIKITFGNNQKTTPDKEFETGPDHFFGTK